MASSFLDLISWVRRNYPAVAATLNPPATENLLQSAEKAIGQQLPADLRAAYLVHDGQHEDEDGEQILGLFGEFYFYSLSDLIAYWHQWRRIDGDQSLNRGNSSATPGVVRPLYTHAGWIPFTGDNSGNHLGVDLSPGPNGTIGQVINFGRDEGEKHAHSESFTQFVSEVHSELVGGNHRPTRHGGFKWKEAPSIALEFFEKYVSESDDDEEDDLDEV